MNARQSRKRLRKLIRAGFQVGKYAGCGTLMLTLGCLPVDNWISVSEDGRYVAVQLQRDTKEVVGCADQNKDHPLSDFYIVDLKTNDARLIGSSDKAWGWLSNTKDSVAFMADTDKDNASVTVMNQGSPLTISGVAYPCLSGDGKRLAYSQMLDDTKSILYVKKLPDGEPVKIAENGFLADFSPNSKYLSFLVVEEMDDNKQQYHLMISNIDGSGQRILDTISDEVYDEVLLMPHWIDNDQVIYKNINQQTGNDGEVFIAGRSGKITQITDNEDKEYFYQATKNGVFYGVARENADKDGIPIYDLNYSRKVKDKWVQKKLGLSPYYYKIAKDKLVYITVDESKESGYQTYIHAVSLKDLIEGKELKPVNLTEIIRKEK